MKKSYPLDGVSMIFPALGGHIYRFGVLFKEPIDVPILKDALQFVAPYFPIIFTHLEKTFTGYVHVPATDLDMITYGDYPLTAPPLTDTQKPSIRIYVKGKKLSLDFFHGNADGNMATRFITALLESYAAMLEHTALPTLYPPEPSTLKDPYILYARKAKGSSLLEKKSYLLHLEKRRRDYVRFSCFSLDIGTLKAYTKSKGHSINDFLCAALYTAIYKGTDAKASPYPITISAPIDLRPFYHCDSQRNFAYFTNVRLGKENGGDLERAMEDFHKQMQKGTDPDTVNAGVAGVKSLSTQPIVKYAPRALKDAIIRAVYDKIANGGITTTLSNLGYKKLSPVASKYVQRLEGYLGVQPGKLNAIGIGSGNTVSLCLSVASPDHSVEEQLKTLFQSCGIAFQYEETEYNV